MAFKHTHRQPRVEDGVRPKDWKLVPAKENLFEIINRFHGPPGGGVHAGINSTKQAIRVRALVFVNTPSIEFFCAR